MLSLEGLVDLLQSSESTVRRDLDELASQGKLRRVHGGAEKIQTLQEELSNQQKSVKNIHDKQVIAQGAARLIEEGDVVFIDAGTTTDLLIDYLPQGQVTVVTNSIHHAVKLVDRKIKTLIIGGSIKSSTDASIGPMAVEQLQRLNFDKAFLGMNGVDGDDLTTPDMEEAVVKSTVIANARRAYVLVDASKIGQSSFVKVAKLSQVQLVTTGLDPAIVTTLKEKTRVIEV